MRCWPKFLSLWREYSLKQSALEALRRLMKGKAWEALLLETPDWRHLFANAAAKLNVPEERLLRTIAQRLGLAFWPEVPPLNLEVLPPGCSISNLRRAGAIALGCGKTVTGFVCVDPRRLGRLISVQDSQGVFIGSWSAIAKALDQSERDFLGAQARLKEKQLKAAAKLVEKVLGLVVREAQSYGAKEIKIELEQGRLQYRFESREGRLAQGGIDDSIAETLLGFLGRAAQEKYYEFKDIDPARSAWVQVATENPATSYRVIKVDEVQTEAVHKPSEVVADLDSHVAQLALTPGGSDVIQIDLPANGPASSTAGAGEPQEFLSQVLPFPGKEGQLPGLSAVKGCSSAVVLIIDDNQSFVRVLERFLTRHGFKTVQSASCEGACELIKSGSLAPQLIICDIHMPGLNGFDFLKWVRTESLLGDVPLIMLSSDDDIETRLRVLNDGADIFVGKTEDPRILCAHVKQLVTRRKAA